MALAEAPMDTLAMGAVLGIAAASMDGAVVLQRIAVLGATRALELVPAAIPLQPFDQRLQPFAPPRAPDRLLRLLPPQL